MTAVSIVQACVAAATLLVLFSWALVGLAKPQLAGRLTKSRDIALVVLNSPALALQTGVIWCWARLVSAVAGEGGASEVDTAWKALWSASTPEAKLAVHLGASQLVVGAVLLVIAASPGMAEACVLSAGVSECNVPEFYPVQVGDAGGWYYVNTTAAYYLHAGDQNTASRGARFNQNQVKANTECAPGQYTPTQWDTPIAEVVMAAGGTVTVPGEACYGGTISVGVGSFVTVSIGFTTVYCPSQTATMQMQDAAVKTYVSWQDATGHGLWSATSAHQSSLCRLNVGCTPFPWDGTAWGPLYIASDGSVSTGLTGAVAEVSPPGPGTLTQESGSCDANSCWSAGIVHSDCLFGDQYTGPSTADVAFGRVQYDPTAHLVVSPWFGANHPEWMASGALTCAQQAQATGLIPSILQIQNTPDGASVYKALCQSAGRIRPSACSAAGAMSIDRSRAGTPSTNPMTGGGEILFECQGLTGQTTRWVRAGTAPPPPHSGEPPPPGRCHWWQRGIMRCWECESRVCAPAGVGLWPPVAARRAMYSPPAVALSPGAWLTKTVTAPAVKGSPLCDLTVDAATRTSVTVSAAQYPCLTAGTMWAGTLTGPAVWDLHIRGWATQQASWGTLWWLFNASIDLPPTSNETWTVSPHGFAMAEYAMGESCSSSKDCSACPWDCSGEILCMIARWHWEGCKCALISEGPSGSLLCRLEVNSLRVLLYAMIVMGGAAVIGASYKAVRKRAGKSVS